MSIVRRLARPLLGSVFIVSGIDALRCPQERAEKAAPLLAKVPGDAPIPTDPEQFVRLNGAALVLGGAMLATGRLPRVGAALVAASIIPDTVTNHPFWTRSDPDEQAADRSHFVKNLGLLGGALLASVDTAGKPGMAWRANAAAKQAGERAKAVSAQVGDLVH